MHVQFNEISNQVLGTVPTLVGMGLKDAVNLLENSGFVVTVTGRGKVVSQSLAAGTQITKGQHISIILN